MNEEALITINHFMLTSAQSMTVRVALNNFAMQLKEGLGDDEIGRLMSEAYLKNTREILEMLHAGIKVHQD